jgi:hypothetical protein
MAAILNIVLESGVHGSPGNREHWPNMKKSSEMDLAESRSSLKRRGGFKKNPPVPHAVRAL